MVKVQFSYVQDGTETVKSYKSIKLTRLNHFVYTYPICTGLYLHPICTGGGANLPPYLKTDW